MCGRLFASQAINADRSDQLKVGTYNLLNLYMHKGNIRKEGSGAHDKPLWAIKEMGKLLKEQDYDIFVAQEVESIGSAKKFNEEFLGDQYHIYSTTTKDVRGLFVVFFVKKSLSYHVKIESHAEEMWFDPLKQHEAPLFERDLPTLHIFKNKDDAVPMLTMIGAHFKSKRDRYSSRDPATSTVEVESNVIRTAQANRTTEIIQRYQMKFGYDHPILIAGDFNSNHNFAPEYAGFFRHAKLTDTLGYKDSGVERYSDRTTHSFFGKGRPKHNQLDGILVTPSLIKYLIQSYVVKYKDEDGSERDIPRTKDARKKNPSDHRPVTAIFSTEELESRQ